jgi:hypothetical protein
MTSPKMSDMNIKLDDDCAQQQHKSDGGDLSKVAACSSQEAPMMLVEPGTTRELDDERRTTPKGLPADAHSSTTTDPSPPPPPPSSSSKKDKDVTGEQATELTNDDESQQDITAGSCRPLVVESENAIIPLQLIRPPRAYVFPGAFAHDGIGANNRSRSTPPDDTFIMESQPDVVTPVDDSLLASNNPEDGLAVARPVNDDEEAILQDLPQAEDTTILDRKRAERQKKVKAEILLVGVIFLIALVGIILLAVPIPSQQGTSTTTISGTPSESLSSSPTPVPTTLEGHYLSLFPNDTIAAITTDEDLQNNSPQSKAFQWLLEDIAITNGSLLPDDERLKQRFALATLYFATNGNRWTNNTRWLNHSDHECDWYNKPDFAQKGKASQFLPGYMREIHPSSQPTPTTCDKKGLYQHLWLDQNNLEGELPDELYMLTSLQTLSLGTNQLHGTIASHIGQLTLLEGLVINYLQGGAGAIPTEIGLLRDTLRALDLESNNHEGSLPSELWQLSKMEYMLVGNNQDLGGSIPSEIGTISKLRWLAMEASGFTGKSQSCVVHLLPSAR